MEITVTAENTEKRMKRNEDSLRNLWDIKRTNIHIIGVPEGEYVSIINYKLPTQLMITGTAGFFFFLETV